MKSKAVETTPQAVLLFNPMKRLIAKFCSLNATAKTLGVSVANVSCACSGKAISCHNCYMRILPSDIEIEDSDYGTLLLEDFDKLCGLERRYYRDQKMSRTGMKYNMIPNRRNKPKPQ